MPEPLPNPQDDRLAHRRAVIAGLRQLADALVENDDLPIPKVVDITYYPRRKGDTANREEVKRIARILGVRPRLDKDGEHFRAVRRFSRVTYRAVAITKQAKQRWAAMVDYRDSAQPQIGNDQPEPETATDQPPNTPPMPDFPHW